MKKFILKKKKIYVHQGNDNQIIGQEYEGEEQGQEIEDQV